MKLFLGYTEHSSGGEICEGEEDSDFPEYEDTIIDWKIRRCSLTRGGEFYTEEIDLDLDLKAYQTIHIVYVRYYTGCTFSSTLGCWEIIEVCTDIDKAIEVRAKIKNATYVSKFGYNCWDGYFEGLQDCDICSITINE